MNDANPSLKREPLLLKEESNNGESRCFNISLRGWIALFIVATLCFLVVWLAVHLPAPENFQEASHFIEIIFLPVVTAIITCYFATRQQQPKTQPPPAAVAQPTVQTQNSP
jgi:hypothetical protein